MNNKDRVFPGQIFSKVQPIHGYYYDENGERQFDYVGDDLIYDRIQEANNTTDIQQIKSQLIPTVGKDETVDKYFKIYGDIDDFAEEGDNDEAITNKLIDKTVDKVEKDSTQPASKIAGKTTEEGGETK